MKRIIVDHFRRRWLMLALLCLLSVAAGLVLGIERDIRVSAFLFISICITTMDWVSGSPRVLLSLPLTARQIGRAYWWLAVSAPALLFAVFSAIGIFILRLAEIHGEFLGPWLQMFIATGPEDKFPGIWLVTALAAGLFCGSIFWLISGAVWSAALPGAGEPWQKRITRPFFACAFAIALVAGIYSLCKSTISITDKIAIACLFGFAFSVLGWFRAESLFIDSSFRRDVAGAGISRRKFEPRPGYGGGTYLIIRFCSFYLSMAGFLIAFVMGIAGFAVWHDHDRVSWSDVVSQTIVQVQMWSFISSFSQVMMIAPHLKFLRSLPLTSKQLAAIILCVALLPVLIMGGLWTLLLLIKPGILSVLSVWKDFLLDVTPICALATGVVWYSEKRIKRILGIVLTFIVSLVPLFCQPPPGIIIALPVLSLPGALFAISRLLERNEMTYRMKFDLSARWP